ncbi:MAG: CHAD domain-containing protein [Planctomycetaceae bacterium]
MTVEREVKLAVSPVFAMPDLSGVLPGVRMEARGAKTLDAVYFDTPDLRLVRAGASLRFREGEGWTVKLPSDPEDDALTRQEHLFPGLDPAVPDAAVDLVRAYLRTADVEPVAHLRTERTVWALVDERGHDLAEVDDDDVSVLRGVSVALRFREVEVEARPDTPAGLLPAAVVRLRWHGAGLPDPTPKVVRALGPAATAPPDVVVPELGESPTAADVVRRALAAAVVRLTVHDAPVRLNEDPEGVHQARVATRRLRSDLHTFEPLLDLPRLEHVRGELSWLGDLLGETRDADVLLERLRRRVEELPPTERPGASRAIDALQANDKELHARLMDGLGSPRYGQLLDELVWLANDPPCAEAAAAPATEVLPAVVDRPWKTLRKAVDRTEEDQSDEALHAVRIRAKRLRYAAEAAAPVLGRRVERIAAAAAELQGVLGEHQDAVVAGSWLRTWAAAEASPDASFAAGAMAGLEQAAARAARDSWRKAWRDLRSAHRAWR